MKVRDSGMPTEDVWETFFDPARALAALGFDDPTADVVELGCGYGTFTIAMARVTKGTIAALDIDPDMIASTRARSTAGGFHNVDVIERDFVAQGTGLADSSADWAMLFNILHAENPVGLLAEAHRVLRPHGRVAIVHWNRDPATPRGPSLSIRPRPEDCRRWLEQAGFDARGPVIPLPPYHYGLVGVRGSSSNG